MRGQSLWTGEVEEQPPRSTADPGLPPLPAVYTHNFRFFFLPIINDDGEPREIDRDTTIDNKCLLNFIYGNQSCDILADNGDHRYFPSGGGAGELGLLVQRHELHRVLPAHDALPDCRGRQHGDQLHGHGLPVPLAWGIHRRLLPDEV